jgi:PAS domain S-box-containing protein
MPDRPTIKPAGSALRVAGIYCLAAGGWIILSDRIAVRFFGATPWLNTISELKGLLFVAVTSLLLFFVLKRRLDSIAQSQHALSESERRFAAFMDHLPVAAFVRDRQGRYVYANPYWIERFAAGREWKGVLPADLFDPEFIAKADEDHRRILEGEPLVEHLLQLRVQGVDTEWIVRRFPISLGDSGETLVGAFALDVTERRKLEERLRQAAKMEAVGLLAGGIAHDFNNLLTVIGGYAQMLDRWSGNPEAVSRAAAEIRKASDSGALLTGQLLAFTRKQVFQPLPTGLNEAVEASRSLLQRLVGDRLRLELRLAPGPLAVLADQSQIQQILLNLIVNARDAMPGGGAIRISTSAVLLPDEAAASHLGLLPGRYGCLSVSDDGHGMDAETQLRIFEPFFTTKERSKGTGLGLSTVYGIVQQSGGAIHVDSRPGEGSTFHIYLPAAAGLPESASASPRPAGRRRTAECILLVEDDPAVRAVAAQMLKTLGYRVLEAAGGPEALQTLVSADSPIHLVITDVSMPEWQGPEVLRRLREVQPGLKAIYITGFSAELAEHPPHQQDALVVRKPFTLQSLGEAVRLALDSPAPPA